MISLGIARDSSRTSLVIPACLHGATCSQPGVSCDRSSGLHYGSVWSMFSSLYKMLHFLSAMPVLQVLHCNSSLLNSSYSHGHF